MADPLQNKILEAIRVFEEKKIPTENADNAHQAFLQHWQELKAEIENQSNEWRITNIELVNKAGETAMLYKAEFDQFFDQRKEDELLNDSLSTKAMDVSQSEQMKQVASSSNLSLNAREFIPANSPKIENSPTVSSEKLASALQMVKSSARTAEQSAPIPQRPIRYSMSYLTDVMSILNRLASLPNLSDNPTAQEVRRLRTTITTVIGRIKQCGFAQPFYEPIIIAQMQRLFCPGIGVLFRFQSRNEGMSLAEFREFLTSVEELIDGGFSFDREEDAKAKRFKPNAAPSFDRIDQCAASTSSSANYQRAGPSKATGAIPKQPKKAKAKKQMKCLFCNATEHQMFHDKQFLAFGYQARWDYVNQHQICPNCLIAKHGTDVCSKGPCTTCKVKHNSVLCPHNQRN